MKRSIFIYILLCSSIFLSLQGGQGISLEPNQISPQQISTASAKIINVNPATPAPGETVSFTADVISPVGVDQSRVELVYDAQDISFSGQVSPDAITAVDETPSTIQWDSKTDLGSDTFGFSYSYVSDYLTDFVIDIQTDNSDTISYFEIVVYNLETASWNSIYSHTENSGGYTYTETSPVGGVRIYLEMNDGGKSGTEPTFGAGMAFSAERRYSFSLTTSTEITGIDYYIKALDMNGQEFTSDTFTIFTNNKPSVNQYYDLPAELLAKDSFLVNVSISDPEGYQSIEKVNLLYKTASQTYYHSKDLEFDFGLSSTEAIYSGMVDLTVLGQFEEDLQFYLNITDTVSEQTQPSVQTSQQTIFVDNQGPTLLGSIDFTASPFINNATTVDSSILMDMTFGDAHGVASANISYTINQADTTNAPLENKSPLQEGDTSEGFSFQFPTYNETANIAYEFVTQDFLGNTYVSDTYFVYIDDDAPVVIETATEPFQPSNSSGAIMVYNILDPAGVASQEFFYSLNGTEFVSADISPINYADELVQNQTLSAEPVGIEDNTVTNVSLALNSTIEVDEALLNLSLSHDRPSDLRIYMSLGEDARESFLVFNQEDKTSLTVDLSEYYNIQELRGEKLILEIEDHVEGTSGRVLQFDVVLRDYNVPFGYTYQVTIPPHSQDINVSYYFTLSDNLGNSGNTSMGYIYLDGIPPKIIDYSTYSSEVDAEGADSLPFDIDLEDKGGIGMVELYYRDPTNQNWTIDTFTSYSETNFQYNLTLTNTTGSLEYYIRVIDNAGWETNTSVHYFTYINANAPHISLQTSTFGVLDLTGKDYIRIEAEITDNTAVDEVIIHYRFDDGDYQTQNMSVSSQDNYYSDILVPSQDGELEFFITATDTDGLQTTSDTYLIQYANADVSNWRTILPWLGGIVGLATLGGIGYVIYMKFKKPTPSILTKIP